MNSTSCAKLAAELDSVNRKMAEKNSSQDLAILFLWLKSIGK